MITNKNILKKNITKNTDLKKTTTCVLHTVYVLLFSLSLVFKTPLMIYAEEKNNNAPQQTTSLEINAKSAVLMEPSTGKIIYEKNADEALPPASVTKIMTLLLIYDSVESGKIKWDDTVTISEHAASMGGSQIFLEPNEQQKVSELTKSIAIASANDAAVAMAEFIGGSEEGFVEMMNRKAKELGMKNTNFENACGLDSENHLMSAKDIAIMSRELTVKYPDIKKYTTTWQDTIIHKTKKGESEFGLTNTNKLIKWYNGATGLKTGSTGKALYCLSGTAEKNGFELIAVVMAAPDPKVRFQEVMKMLDFGFAGYTVAKGLEKGSVAGSIGIYKGCEDFVDVLVKDDIKILIPKGSSTNIDSKTEISEGLIAPAEKGSKAGEIIYYYNGEEVGRSDLITAKTIEKAQFNITMQKLLIKWLQ